jgi:hypothetical protein
MWSYYIEYLASKVNQRLGLLRKIKHLIVTCTSQGSNFILQSLSFSSAFNWLCGNADVVWGDKKIPHLIFNSIY